MSMPFASVLTPRYCVEQMFASQPRHEEHEPVMDIGKDLTKRQQEIFDFIKKYSAKYGYPPTVRDIGKAVGLASSSTVHAHLANLEKIGLLRRDPTKPRAIELLDRAADAVKAIAAARGGGRGRRCGGGPGGPAAGRQRRRRPADPRRREHRGHGAGRSTGRR